jgi:hypothetical protein
MAVHYIIQPIPGRYRCSNDSPHALADGEMILYDVLSLSLSVWILDMSIHLTLRDAFWGTWFGGLTLWQWQNL